MSLSLYIHYPFCKNLCDYCDFYKQMFDHSLENSYFKALRKELDLAKAEIDPDLRRLDTIYIGGGTPSLMGIDLLNNFMERLRKSFYIKRNCEFSFEINPESIDRKKLQSLKQAGVNRPVFGIQSFNKKQLQILKRKHNPEDSFRALYLTRALGFDNFGVDLIFGLPYQTGKNLASDLNQLIELEPPHISYYQLTVEDGTPLKRKVESGKVRLPGENLSAAMYKAIIEELKAKNYFRYEVSSFSKAGYECRHNSHYWDGGDYLGLGPAAHSFIGDRRFANISNLTQYMKSLKNGRRPLIKDTNRKDDRVIETIMLSLRTARGLNIRKFKNKFNTDLKSHIDENMLRLLTKAKLATSSRGQIKLTDSGFLVADEIISRLISK